EPKFVVVLHHLTFNFARLDCSSIRPPARTQIYLSLYRITILFAKFYMLHVLTVRIFLVIPCTDLVIESVRVEHGFVDAYLLVYILDSFYRPTVFVSHHVIEFHNSDVPTRQVLVNRCRP